MYPWKEKKGFLTRNLSQEKSERRKHPK